jgi:hypothetical protein
MRLPPKRWLRALRAGHFENADRPTLIGISNLQNEVQVYASFKHKVYKSCRKILTGLKSGGDFLFCQGNRLPGEGVWHHLR